MATRLLLAYRAGGGAWCRGVVAAPGRDGAGSRSRRSAGAQRGRAGRLSARRAVLGGAALVGPGRGAGVARDPARDSAVCAAAAFLRASVREIWRGEKKQRPDVRDLAASVQRRKCI